MARFDSKIELSNSDFAFANRSFSVFTNPINQSVTLDLKLVIPENLTVDLYDSFGRKISNLIQNTDFPAGNTMQKLELPESLSKGVYFLSISNGKVISNLKIIK
jgi:hypothetical protein